MRDAFWYLAGRATFATISNLEHRPEERHAHVRGTRGFVRVHLYFDLDGRSASSMQFRARTPRASPARRRACCVSTFLDSLFTVQIRDFRRFSRYSLMRYLVVLG